MVRVLLDATAIPADRGGVGRYVECLVQALLALPEGELSLSVACRRGDAARFGEFGAPVHVGSAVLERRPTRLAWEQSGLPLLARRVRADVVHSPHYTMPLALAARSVVTLHDATFFSDPGLHLAVKARFFRAATRVAARRARWVVVPSTATRDELSRFTALDERRVTVAPHGVDHEQFAPPTATAIAALRARLGVESYVAFLGTIEPRKNVANLIAGWVSAVRDDPTPPALVLAGGPGWDEQVDAAVAAVPDRLRVIRPGYLPVHELPALLAGAELFVYPSLGEGFGLPVLEAMACGAAVLTTAELALPEVGGDAVAYTGTGAHEIGESIAALLKDPEARSTLRQAAVRRASQYSWTRCAELHLQAYHAAAA